MQSCSADRPLGLQLFGDDPQLLATGATLAAGLGDLIDINMGCPVRKVVGSGAGSALLQSPDRVRAIVAAVRKATSLPLTVKIRSGWGANTLNYLLIGRIAEDEGADAVTLHPRTRAQMFDGRAEWRHIEQLKKELSVPVIGSGDLFTAEDVLAMLEMTGCDGVMIARGALGNPWIFREALALQRGEEKIVATAAERFTVAIQHFELFAANAGERIAVREMRKHLCWYARGLQGAARFRAVVNRLEERLEVEKAMDDFFMQGQHEA
jgi:nifR3 family TIM-barrel protein